MVKAGDMVLLAGDGSFVIPKDSDFGEALKARIEELKTAVSMEDATELKMERGVYVLAANLHGDGSFVVPKDSDFGEALKVRSEALKMAGGQHGGCDRAQDGERSLRL